MADIDPYSPSAHLAPWAEVDRLRGEVQGLQNALDVANHLLAEFRKQQAAIDYHATAWIDGDCDHFCPLCGPETERARWQSLAIYRGNKMDRVLDILDHHEGDPDALPLVVLIREAID